MRRINISRVKAKIRQYRIQKSVTRSSMVQGDINDYIKDLITLYNTKNQLSSTMITVPVNNK